MCRPDILIRIREAITLTFQPGFLARPDAIKAPEPARFWAGTQPLVLGFGEEPSGKRGIIQAGVNCLNISTHLTSANYGTHSPVARVSQIERGRVCKADECRLACATIRKAKRLGLHIQVAGEDLTQASTGDDKSAGFIWAAQTFGTLQLLFIEERFEKIRTDKRKTPEVDLFWFQVRKGRWVMPWRQSKRHNEYSMQKLPGTIIRPGFYDIARKHHGLFCQRGPCDGQESGHTRRKPHSSFFLPHSYL